MNVEPAWERDTAESDAPQVSRKWRTVDAEGIVTGEWVERPPAHDEAWVRACIAEHYPADRIEVQVTTVGPWTPDTRVIPPEGGTDA